MKPWLYFGLVVAVIAVLVGCFLKGQHDGVAAEQARMKPVIAGYQLRIAELTAALNIADQKIKAANEQIQALVDAGVAREKANAAALKTAKKEADRYRLKAAEIAASKPTGDQCEASRALIVKILSEERQ